MTSSRGFHSHVEILNLKPSTKKLGLQLNPWLNHIDTWSRSQSLGKNTERYTSYPQITDHHITRYYSRYFLSCHFWPCLWPTWYPIEVFLPCGQLAWQQVVGGCEMGWMQMKQCGANLSARIMNPCHTLLLFVFLSVVVKMFILLVDMICYTCVYSTKIHWILRNFARKRQKEQVTSPIIASPVVTSKGVEFYFSAHSSRCKLFHGSLWWHGSLACSFIRVDGGYVAVIRKPETIINPELQIYVSK